MLGCKIQDSFTNGKRSFLVDGYSQQFPIHPYTPLAPVLVSIYALLAEKAGVGVSTVRDFERGVRVPIKQNLLALQRTFSESGVDLEALQKAFRG